MIALLESGIQQLFERLLYIFFSILSPCNRYWILRNKLDKNAEFQHKIMSSPSSSLQPHDMQALLNKLYTFPQWFIVWPVGIGLLPAASCNFFQVACPSSTEYVLYLIKFQDGKIFFYQGHPKRGASRWAPVRGALQHWGLLQPAPRGGPLPRPRGGTQSAVQGR